MDVEGLFGSGASASKAVLQSSVLRAYDSFPVVRLPRSLFESLVKTLFALHPAEQLTLVQFAELFALVSAKMTHGEPALGRLVGKENVDVSDEWLHGKSFSVEYVAVAAAPTQRTPLFRKGDDADCCFLVAKGFVWGCGADPGKPGALWGENDVIGLDDVLLRQRARSYSAWIEAAYGTALACQPLFLRVAASSFVALEPREWLHFFAGALRSLRSIAGVANSSNGGAKAVRAVAALPSAAVARGTLLCKTGDVVSCVYYIVSGELRDEVLGAFGPGALVFLPEYLSTDGKVASASLVAAADCVLVSLNFEGLVALLADAEFKELVLEALRIRSATHSGGYALSFLSRGDVFPSDGSAKLLSGRLERGVCCGDTVMLVSDARQNEAVTSRSVTLAVVESAEGVENLNFCLELCSGFKGRGCHRTSLICGSDFVAGFAVTLSELAALSPVHARNYLRHARMRNERTILYVPLSSSLAWARECFAAADTLLLVQSEDEDCATVNEANVPLLSVVPNSTPWLAREVVLLRKGSDKFVLPMALSMQRRGFAWSKFHHVRVSSRSDVRTLCRTLCGRSVALVLGGHAEGVSCFAYLGVLEAFRFHNVPIDILGGSYSGAMVGAMHGLGMGLLRSARRIKRMQPRFGIIDPLLDMGLFLFDRSLSFMNRLKRSIETTYSRPVGRSERAPYAVEDMRVVSQFYASATHAEYGLPVTLDRGPVHEIVTAAVKLPLIMGGSLVCGSFSDPLPLAPAAAEAWRCFSVNVNVPVSGDARGGPLWNALIDGAAHATVSHLAVAAAVAATRGWSDSSGAIVVPVADVLADEYGRAPELCQRGYDAACAAIERLKHSDPEFARETAPEEAHAVPAPNFAFATLPFRRNYRRIAKIGALVAFGLVVFFWVRKKAIEAEQFRLQEFIRGESMVKTQFVVKESE